MARHGKARRGGKGRGHSSRLQGNCPLGVIDIAREGYGFVETQEGTFYIPANRTGGAMNGDTVEVRPRPAQRGAGMRQEAVVVRVHKRALEYVVGVLRVCDPLAAVVPQDPRVQHDIFVDMRLSQLTGLRMDQLHAEYEELERQIAYFQQILSDPELCKLIIPTYRVFSSPFQNVIGMNLILRTCRPF